MNSSKQGGCCRTLLLLAVLPFSAAAQNEQVVHWINNLGQNAVASLNASNTFTTSFKTTNDVVVTLVSGSINSIYPEPYVTTGTENNPAFVTGFIGRTNTGTGDGVPGHVDALETTLSSTLTAIQFDFAVPLTTQDRIFLTDADNSEQYVIQAYKSGSPLSLIGWPYFNYSGESSQLPDANWAVWNPTNGTLAASSVSLTEPLFMLAPTQTVDRVVLTKNPVGGGSLTIQFMTVGLPPLQIQFLNPGFVVNWPGSFSNYFLYQSTNLSTGSGWTLAATNPALVGGNFVVTNSAPPVARFYRLQIPLQ